MPFAPSRRDLLRAAMRFGALAGLGVVPGCTDRPAPPTQDEVLIARIVSEKQALVGAYERAQARHPVVRPRTAPLLANARSHLAAVVALSSPTPSEIPSASATGRASARSTGPASALASGLASARFTDPASAPASGLATPQATLRSLAAAEKVLAARRPSDVASPVSGPLARLVASIGGAEAAASALLSRP